MEKTQNKILIVLSLIVIAIFAVFGYQAVQLVKFKKCYDINFQKKECEKYLGY